MLSINSENFTSSFPVWILLIPFPFLIAMAKISKTMLNSSGKSGHPCLVPDFRGNAFSFSPLRIMFAVYGFYYVEVCSFYSCFWRVFFISGLLNFVEDFLCICQDNQWGLSFNLLMQCITMISLQMLKNPCIPGVKATWS